MFSLLLSLSLGTGLLEIQNTQSSRTTNMSKYRALSAASLSVAYFVYFEIELALLLSLVSTLALIGLRSSLTFLRLLRRDATIFTRLIRLKLLLRYELKNDSTVAKVFARTVARELTKPMFITNERTWSFLEVDKFTNRVGNCFQQMGFSQGDTVALLMENRPEYVFFWLGLSKVGIVSALVNTNLRSTSLAYSLKIVNAKAVVFSNELAPAIFEILEDIKSMNIQLFALEASTNEINATMLSESLLKASSSTPSFNGGKMDDDLMFIYTSGTTGMPKAAIIKQRRYIQLGHAAANLIPVKSKDVIYLYLPFYHMAGTCLGASQCIMNGATGIIVPKFSARNFWSDCAKYGVTVCQYIGEICRYLLAQPERPVDKQHNVKLMYGNGLRKENWMQFKRRFGIANIRELYGSTEGTTSLLNIDNTVGAIGFFPMIANILSKYIPMKIIKVDPTTGVPLRNNLGRCIICEPGEIGEIVAVIRNDPLAKFDGYADKKATEKKIYRDCFVEGDRVFSSGDLVYRDHQGYVYFKDRTGDTFRWKGENISTTEVEGVIVSVIGDSSIGCCVFGVEIPGTEGRAGMTVLIDISHKIQPQVLLSELNKRLPSYALPVFLRITTADDVTGTFKMTKVNFQKQGYDIEICQPDILYFLHPALKEYVKLDDDLLKQINCQQIRL